MPTTSHSFIIINFILGKNVFAYFDGDSYDHYQWQGLYNGLTTGVRKESVDYYDTRKDNILLDSYNEFQQNYNSVIPETVTPSSFVNNEQINLSNNEQINLSNNEDWRTNSQVEKNIDDPVHQTADYQTSQSLIDDSSASQYSHPIHVQVPKYYPVVKTIVVPVVKKVAYAVEKIVPVYVQKDVPITVEKYIPVPVEQPYPIHIPIYRHVFYKSPLDYDEYKHNNINKRRSYRRNRWSRRSQYYKNG
ncbi:hypothetical protein HCN44_002662 [Aphidius gifuensis]|uniref:Uncharacterized protein n=1 Tax=Aphidius gifuensis TaxID=684658 RepID=A0A835CSB7_APHGI|nr:hypothetical protein HCN44_002662 [Aphidius gifuensis]